MLVIKNLDTSGQYNRYGFPIVEKLVTHQNWYLIVSTTQDSRFIETRVFLSDKFGLSRYSDRTVCFLIWNDQHNYRDSEAVMFSNIRNLPWHGITDWADNRWNILKESYDAEQRRNFVTAVCHARGV